jgi:acetyl-CoA synthetase
VTAPVWFPSDAYKEQTRLYQWMKMLGYSSYDDFYQRSIDDIAWFWREVERELDIPWMKPYDHVLAMEKGPAWPEWFIGGKLNVTEAAVEKWANDPKTANKTAIVWEGEEGKTSLLSFAALDEAVKRAAHGLKQHGVKKGDVFALYMPMIPETVIAMLAVAKLGAIFTPIFSGYGAEAIATRLRASGAKWLITVDGCYRRGKLIDMRQEAEKALADAPNVQSIVVVERVGTLTSYGANDIRWTELMTYAPLQETAAMNSADPLMLIYTSGTTGRPKGAVHTHSGFPIKAAFDAGIGMDLRKEDTLFWLTDMGWMMGPFLVFAGLINGATIVLYDGAPDYPNHDRLWQLVEQKQVSHLGISPTLIRAMMKYGTERMAEHDLSCLKVIGSTGEPWNPEPWHWLFEHVGNKQVPIFNYSGGTEISGGILGNVLVRPIGPITFNSAIPGMAAAVYNESGEKVTAEVGELVLTKPWVGMTNGFWQEPERFLETYWSRWSNTWVHGDWVTLDADGFWTITGRSDDILNVAGKRLGPAEVESVLVGHQAVIEAGTIGVPDDVKGEVPICFVVIAPSFSESDTLRHELIQLVGTKLGKALKPKAVYFVSDLPKTRNAKVMRRAIRAAFLQKEAGDLSSLENAHVLKEIERLGTKQSS